LTPNTVQPMDTIKSIEPVIATASAEASPTHLDSYGAALIEAVHNTIHHDFHIV